MNRVRMVNPLTGDVESDDTIESFRRANAEDAVLLAWLQHAQVGDTLVHGFYRLEVYQ